MKSLILKLMQPLRIRLLASFVLLITICLLSLSVITSSYYHNSIQEQNIMHSRQMLEQVQYAMDAYVRSGETLINTIINEPLIQDYLNLGKNQDDIRVELETKLRRRLISYANLHDEIGGILIAPQDDKLAYLSYGFYRLTQDRFSSELWYKSTVASNNLFILAAPIGRNLQNWKNYATHDVVMLSKIITDPLTGNPIGVVCVDLMLKDIQNLLEKLKLGQNGTIYIMDDKNEIVYAPTNSLTFRTRPEWVNRNNGKEPHIYEILSNKYLLLYNTSEYTKWKTIALFPYGVPIDTVRSLQRITFLIALLTILFATLVANIITKSITKPLFLLHKQMLRAEQGDLDAFYSYSTNSEIGQLGNSFNTMMNKIRSLLDIVVIEQRSKREAELTALQAQINPHFLYNTLDTIQWMALDRGAPEIGDLVTALTSLFRISLSRGKEFIRLRDELQHVENYLYIQKIRYEDKLNYQIRLDESFDQSLLERPVLKLMLQPLVENAIYHGIKPKKGSGNILIKLFKNENTFILEVEDDGVGMPDDKITLMNDSLANHEHGSGYGSFNVNERLYMHFGEHYGLRLASSPSGGIISKLTHPILDEFPKS